MGKPFDINELVKKITNKELHNGERILVIRDVNNENICTQQQVLEVVREKDYIKLINDDGELQGITSEFFNCYFKLISFEDTLQELSFENALSEMSLGEDDVVFFIKDEHGKFRKISDTDNMSDFKLNTFFDIFEASFYKRKKF